MNYLHQEFELGPEDIIEVSLDGQANVLLLDPPNYENYRQGRAYRYFGGLAKSSPVRLIPPRYGRWHVVVDLGGFSGRIQAGIRVLEGANSGG